MNEALMERFDALRENRLSEQERKSLEAELKSNPELQAQWLQYQEAERWLTVAGSLHLKTQMQAVAPGTGSPGLVVRLWQRKSWLVAAGIALLLSVSMWWWYPSAPPPNTLAAWYEVYPSENLRSEDEERDTPFALGMKAYQQRELAGAVERLSVVPENDPRYLETTFYRGVALLGLAQAEPAVLDLAWVVEQEDARFGEAAQWYLLLAYWQVGALDEAEALARRLREEASPFYAEQARAWQESLHK